MKLPNTKFTFIIPAKFFREIKKYKHYLFEQEGEGEELKNRDEMDRDELSMLIIDELNRNKTQFKDELICLHIEAYNLGKNSQNCVSDYNDYVSYHDEYGSCNNDNDYGQTTQSINGFDNDNMSTITIDTISPPVFESSYDCVDNGFLDLMDYGGIHNQPHLNLNSIRFSPYPWDDNIL